MEDTSSSANRPPQETKNRRHFSRISFKHQLTLESSTGHSYQGAFNDISLKGMLFWSEPLPQKDEKLSGILHLGDLELHIHGVVVHSLPDRGVALYFQDMDVESFSHLRRLISLNMGDSETIDKEFFSSL